MRNQFVESQVMMQYAHAQGVPASALFTEEDSHNTIQNAYYSYRIMQAKGWTSALIVTSPTHVRRASLIFQHYPLAWKMDEPPGHPIIHSGRRPGSGSAKPATRLTDASLAFLTPTNIYPIPISGGRGSREDRQCVFTIDVNREPGTNAVIPSRDGRTEPICSTRSNSKNAKFMPKFSGFQFNRPQQLAALLLLLLVAQCLWVFHRQTLTSRDYDFARCGREMWEKPDPLAGYFTSCGNIPDGTLGYRIAGLPLTLSACSPARPRTPQPGKCATNSVTFWCCCTAVSCSPESSWGERCGGLPGASIGNPGGFIALALYCFSPAVIHACTYPNNEILTAFGLFASLYTAMGVAHAMQGPPRKWRSRIVLLTLTLAFTAASHVAAFLLALLLSIGLMAYLAVGRRAYIVPIMMAASIGTLLLLFASYDFQPRRLQLLLSQRRRAHRVFS